MLSGLKNIIKPLIPEAVLVKRRENFELGEIEKWKAAGSPVPPPHSVKRHAIKDCQRRSGYNVFVETGTYMGDMIEVQKRYFNRLFSIELGEDLYKKAKKRFENDPRIKIVLGDSGKVLPNVMKDIDEPAVFWLDGHYSAGITAQGDKDCPIFEEINSIFDGKGHDHIILIDDARCFVGQGDYPTVEALTEHVRSKNPQYQVEVRDDIIRFFTK